ncbi:uncharacterized protein LOC118101631 [Hippoglossus stenolepis]|uniref:uncharacterized protein LOC118101631 n=1 Tax=Hippoglossus stenolepis TaxID=195615 RepID=UPI001FAF7B77|nr:uncharacterized protein LOC118101631 [Hippoglossus stenolepis]
MDQTCTSKQNRRLSNLSGLLLLLLLAGLQSVLSSDGEQPEQGDSDDNRTFSGGVNVTIIGPDYVTLGVPSTVECDAGCPGCLYSMSLDGQTAQGQGNVLAFTVNEWVGAVVVSCTATDEDTQQTATTTKKLQVLDGPANISIAGADLMNPTLSHTYSCHAHCRPSCSYTWRSDHGPWIGGQGNVISIVPQEMNNSTVLTCKATNTVSGLFIAATRRITVITGPSKVQIEGPDIVEIAQKYKFMCSAECLPSCRYLSSVDGQTVRGNVIEIRLDHPLKSFTLKCEAQNTASRRTATVLKSVQVKGSNGNLSVRPEETSALLLLAFMMTVALSL